MTASGPLFAIGLALFFTGLYRAMTGARLFETRGDWACVVLGACMCAAAYTMFEVGL
jgi:uncharacterized membrane protein HdeD (DUF308 family)